MSPIKDFLILFLFNYKKMLKSWMSKVLIGLALCGVLCGAFLMRSINERTDVKVIIHDEVGLDMSQAHIISALVGDNGGYEYYVHLSGETYLNQEMAVVTNPVLRDAETAVITIRSNSLMNYIVTLDYDDPGVFTTSQKNRLLKVIETDLVKINQVIVPTIELIDVELVEEDLLKEVTYYMIVFIIYLFILLCGSILTSSVALEKISKVSDLIVYRVSPIKIVYSKVLALYAMLIQIIICVAVEIGLLNLIGFIELDAVFNLFTSIGFDVYDLIFVGGIVFAGISVYTILYIIVGLFIESAEQVQFSQFPIAAIALISFVISILSKSTPDSSLSQIAVYIPVFFPFVAPLRLINQLSSLQEVLVAFAIVVVYLVLGNILITKLFLKEVN